MIVIRSKNDISVDLTGEVHQRPLIETEILELFKMRVGCRRAVDA